MNNNRRFEDGITIIDKELRVRIFPNCITISANNRKGWDKLNTLRVSGCHNVDILRDGMGEMHTLIVYFMK